MFFFFCVCVKKNYYYPCILLMYRKETHKFVILDFQFSSINRYSKVLISGAISNSLERFKITKPESKPLYLPRVEEEVKPMSDHEARQTIKEIQRIFVKKPELRDACLEQFKMSLKSSQKTLNETFIRNCLRKSDKQCIIIILFYGSSDKKILEI